MANYREDIVDIELKCGNIHRSFMKHSIGEGDENADRFGVRVFRDGQPENLTGSCYGMFIRADGQTVTINSGTISGNVAYVTLPEACYAVEGVFSLAIKVTATNNRATLRIVDGVVSRTSTDVAVDPGTIIPSIDDLIEEIEEAIASIPSDYSALSADVASLKISTKRAVYGINVKVDINTSAHSATFTGGRVVSLGHLYTIPSNTAISSIPQDNRIYWLICDLASNDTCSFRIVDTSFTEWTDGVVLVGYTYNDTFALIPGFHVFNNGILLHDDFLTWTEYNQNIVRCMQGPERMLIVDLANQTAYIPADIAIISGSKNIVTSTATTLDFSGISGDYLYIYYDALTSSFGITASSVNRNTRMIIALITRAVNYVYSVIPAVVVTKGGKYYDVNPEIVVYGDSIVAGAGGIGFENVIAARAGIRMLNYGIGSTGYVTRVTQGTTHLAGNGKPAAGSNTVIDYAENNITDRITANISNITQNVIAIMAGTNDVATGVPLSDIITAVETCINTIFNAGKIPVIISPIRRENVNLDSFYEALKETCGENGVQFIDVYNCGINPNNAYNKTKYAPDGIHPSDAGYYILSAAIAEGMRKICMVGKYY